MFYMTASAPGQTNLVYETWCHSTSR